MPANLLENHVNDIQSQDFEQTPLYALHRERGARMAPVAGYEMPVQYQGIIVEHLHTRENAALFDVSHMGQVILRGEDVAAALETLVPGDFQELPVGKTRYTVLTNDRGGIIDDLMVTHGGDHLFVVLTASRKEKDLAHFEAHIGGRCKIEVLSDRALLALQGPAAVNVLARLAPPCRHMFFMTGEALSVADVPCFVIRSGYTGEDGFEISVPAEEAEHLARLLLDEPEVRPAGLGARDSLRLEAGFCLYGNDIDETTTPVEAGLSWVIGKRRRAEGGFPGAAVIARQLAEGVERKRVGLRAEGKIPARAHAPITEPDGAEGGLVIGEVTSGGYGPTVGGPVAMGYVKAERARSDTPVSLMVRGKALAARVAKLPFVEHRYFKR
ncbi:MAG: glycine cleavage system aminomethyltransferase GcvT [Alphaproteobacteria bacterium]|nr:glycine cleavage system aminomethyltransferase GcvT [Alphaproteobacteria bacterium]